MDQAGRLLEEELGTLNVLLEENPKKAFRLSSKLAAQALRTQKTELAAKLEEIRLKAFSKTHRPLPRTMWGVPANLALTLLGYIIVYLGGKNTPQAAALPMLAAGGLLVLLFSHPLGHLIAAQRGKIALHGIYLGGKIRVEPTLLVRLDSYHRAKPKSRFWFHMAGPLATVLSSTVLAILVWEDLYPLLVKALVAAIPIVATMTELLNSRARGDVARALKALRGQVQP